MSKQETTKDKREREREEKEAQERREREEREAQAKGPASVADLHEQRRREQQEAVEAGTLRAGTQGGTPDPSILPEGGTVTDPVPGAEKAEAGEKAS